MITGQDLDDRHWDTENSSKEQASDIQKGILSPQPISLIFSEVFYLFPQWAYPAAKLKKL